MPYPMRTTPTTEHSVPWFWSMAAVIEMPDFDTDTYLTDLNTAMDHLGGRVTLVGQCQGGWLSAMYARLYPEKVAALVLAGAPIDTGR